MKPSSRTQKSASVNSLQRLVLPHPEFAMGHQEKCWIYNIQRTERV
jgi:hypothetical protein